MNLYKEFNYDVLSELYFKNNKDYINFDISIIIPVRNRLHFQNAVVSHLQAAIKYSGLNVNITYVEHSELPMYLKQTPCSYIWVPADNGEAFNKCLCFNAGFLYGAKADYYLFYDSDLVCREDFIDQIFSNLSGTMQTFRKRRVLYANEPLTEKIVKHGIFYDQFLNDKHTDIKIGQPGAPGGSILTSRSMFIEVGGYDPELFTGYSIEDQFFFNKLSFYSDVKSLDSVDLIHLDHGIIHARTPDDQMSLLKAFDSMDQEQKGKLIKFKSDILKKHLI